MLNFVIFVIALGLMIVLQPFVRRTRLGRAMRATAQDQQAAQLMGVDLNQTIAMTFLIGGALAGAAGVVWGFSFGFVRQDLGFNAGLKAFTAAVLGGIGNMTGAVIGGFVIGFIENFARVARADPLVGGRRVRRPDVVLVFRPAGHPRPADGRAGMTAPAAAGAGAARRARSMDRIRTSPTSTAR